MRKRFAAITPTPAREVIRAGIQLSRAVHYMRARHPRPLGHRPPVYLAVGALFKNEAPYLAEWVTFHRLQGVERFWLYDNNSTDDWRAALKPELDAGIVEVTPWPQHPGQFSAYTDCFKRRRRAARWIAFIDVDEFLFSPTGLGLPDVLKQFDDYPGVVVNWRVFGSSGHKTRPPSLVTESYLMRAGDHRPANEHSKSVIYPRKTEALSSTAHAFQHYGHAVDERYERAQGYRRQPPTADVLRINHYFTKSEQEFAAKVDRGRCDIGGKRTGPGTDELLGHSNEMRDETILTLVPALKHALRERAIRGLT